MSDWWTNLIGGALGLDNPQSIDGWRFAFAAPWARGDTVVFSLWFALACAAAIAGAVYFYSRCQTHGKRPARIALGVLRAMVLLLIIFLLAEPVVQVTVTSRPRPTMWVLFDGTESMEIEDDFADQQRQQLATAAGLTGDAAKAKLSRVGYVKGTLTNDQVKLLQRLEDEYRLEGYLFDRVEGVRRLELRRPGESQIDPGFVAEQLSTSGKVTAIGNVFGDLAQRQSTDSLAGIVLFSDFAQNSGPAAVGSDRAPVNKLGVPVYTVGIGATAAVDVGVTLQTPLLMKKSERETVTVVLRQNGLEGRRVNVKVTATAKDPATSGSGEVILVGERSVELTGTNLPLEFPYEPKYTGLYEFAAEVEELDEEIVKQNNRATREVNIRDDFLRLMFVENEPGWEWRFIKEVFHRDKLVGIRGFRTFLRSADANVKINNDLFLRSITPPRSEFFQTDVIFLGDMPAHTLSPEFCEMTREFVGKFGGGLVVIAGPRFGPGEIAEQPLLADMLPVVVEQGTQLDDQRDFELRLTPDAEQVDFMRLGVDDQENQMAWKNLGPLAWYQPVVRPHPLATVLAEHPTYRLPDGRLGGVCADGKTPQPLIAIRRYGRGEVVYLGFNETWRLRRKYGEQYYRQFWGQMIHRLGLSHALGSQKRFVVRTDRQNYQADDAVIVSVEAYDADYKPLTEDHEKIENHRLSADLTVPGRSADAPTETRTISVAQVRPGLFEARVPVESSGEYQIRVRDPITGEYTGTRFEVTGLSAERRSAIRNVALEEAIARANNGRSYDLTSVKSLPDEIQLSSRTETLTRVIPLWADKAVIFVMFALTALLLLAEWTVRKANNLQ